MRNLNLNVLKESSPSRKVAMGSWRTTGDPSVYGLLEVDMKKVLDLLPAYQEEHDVKITPSHLVGRALTHCMKLRPEINGMIRGNKIFLREEVTLFYQVNIPGSGEDKAKGAVLSGTTINCSDEMRAKDIAQALYDKAHKVRTGKDNTLKNSLRIFSIMPWWFSRLYLNLGSFLIYGLNLNMSLFGLPRDPFGSVMITNVGSLGIDIAWAPLVPYTRVPLLATVGAIKDKPVAIEGKVEVRPILPIGITFDHRLIDGIHASFMAREFKKCFEEPETYLL